MLQEDDFFIIGDENNTFGIGIKVRYPNIQLPNPENLNPYQYVEEWTRWPSIITRCPLGTFQTYNLCRACPKGTFSFRNSSQCNLCEDEKMICFGRDVVIPRPGYWRINQRSDNFLDCSEAEACLGGIVGNIISSEGFCHENYRGKACSQCIDGFAKLGDFSKCYDCRSDGTYYLVFSLLLILHFSEIHFIRSMIEKAFTETETQRTKVGIMRGLLDYLQFVSIINPNFTSLEPLKTFYHVLSRVFPINENAFSTDCFIVLLSVTKANIFLKKLILIQYMQPFGLILITSAILYLKRKKEDISSSLPFKKRIILNFLVILWILFPGLLKNFFNLFDCKNFGGTESPRYYLKRQPDLECYSEEHISWIIGIAMTSIISWIIIPACLLKKKVFEQEYNTLFEESEGKWAVLVLITKILLILTITLITDNYFQGCIIIFEILILRTMYKRINPDREAEVVSCEKTNITSLMLLNYFSLQFRTPKNSSLVILWQILSIMFGVLPLLNVLRILLSKNVLKITRKRKIYNLSSIPSFEKSSTKLDDSKSEFELPLPSPITSETNKEVNILSARIFQSRKFLYH